MSREAQLAEVAAREGIVGFKERVVAFVADSANSSPNVRALFTASGRDHDGGGLGDVCACSELQRMA
jgi:hypothetical protein